MKDFTTSSKLPAYTEKYRCFLLLCRRIAEIFTAMPAKYADRFQITGISGFAYHRPETSANGKASPETLQDVSLAMNWLGATGPLH